MVLDLKHGNHLQLKTNAFSKKLDETTAELKSTATALEKEKEKTDFLLYQMLPKRVADQLRDGGKVDAGLMYLVTPFIC